MNKYNEAIDFLTCNDNFYIDLGLERIKSVLNKFGNPQDELHCIHVAGTNGKGSVCAILASILQEAGYKTGMYTSPHIWEYTERIKINGRDIAKSDLANLIFEIKEIPVHLTEFEILTVAMFLYFKRNNVDIVILETGLGGRLDATNVIKKNICSIITQIDLDHTDRLGKTKDNIAFEKAGIIKSHCPVVTSMGFEAIKDKADECESMFILTTPFVQPKFIDALTLKGTHQTENLALAINAINYCFKEISDDIIVEGLKKVQQPCRFQYIPQLNLIIDGSHNPNGILALKNNLDTYFEGQKRRFIFGCLKTKDYEKMINILFKDDDEIYFNEFEYPNACSVDELQSKCKFQAKKYTSDNVITPDKLNVICGSFYMIGQMDWLKPAELQKNFTKHYI